MVARLWLLFVFVCTTGSVPIQQEGPCKTACHPVDVDRINVHLIPHSHDDVGWLKTVDQYYYGSQDDIQRAGVQYIITSTIDALKSNPERRFVQVETAFFWQWWREQDVQVQQDFRRLVDNGQLEMINGAWSMNDEATTNYQSTIDQFTWGLRTINETLGPCAAPRVGWQIDPFGHSREQASIFARLGFDAVFFSRIDFNDKKRRIADRTMEVVWRGSANLENVHILASAFPKEYEAPPGFCYDIDCDDPVIVDDAASPDYNVPNRTDVFTKFVKLMSSYYRTNNVLIPMGGDFQFQAAAKNFINMDRLIKALRHNKELNVFYSTPSCYVKAVHEAAKAANVQFVEKTDDYFPYASDPHCYWTGYFTSRPNAKRFERMSNNILQAAKQLAVFSKILGKDIDAKITPLREAMGVLQHHDAITGTAKRAVAKDYARLLTSAIHEVEAPLSDTINNLLRKQRYANQHLNLSLCLLANVSVCDASSGDEFVVAVYNPLAHTFDQYVRIPVSGNGYKVTGPDGVEVSDVVESISAFAYLKNQTPNPYELVFNARNLPGLGVKLYHIEKINKTAPAKRKSNQTKFGTASTNFEIDPHTGLLKAVTIKGFTLEISQQFLYYQGSNGTNDDAEKRASGAYIFRPVQNNATEVRTGPVAYEARTGRFVDEVRQTFSPWITQIIRVYKPSGSIDNNFIEFDWLVGPIEVDELNRTGREIISRFVVKNFDNNGAFYTDSNGREMLKRQRNKRYDYDYEGLEPAAANYYPVTSRMVLVDEARKVEVAVLTDRAQGGSSLRDGELELMVHRRLLQDDAKGVGEALNDTEFGRGVVARGSHVLVIGPGAGAADPRSPSTSLAERVLALKKLIGPLVMVAAVDKPALSTLKRAFHFEFRGLATPAPPNVHLLTLEPWREDAVLLRVEHFLERGDDDIWSQEAIVNLGDLFTLFNVEEAKETTLGANLWAAALERAGKPFWGLEGGATTTTTSREIDSNSLERSAFDFNVSLAPMEIKTFVVKISKKM